MCSYSHRTVYEHEYEYDFVPKDTQTVQLYGRDRRLQVLLKGRCWFRSIHIKSAAYMICIGTLRGRVLTLRLRVTTKNATDLVGRQAGIWTRPRDGLGTSRKRNARLVF